VQRRNSHGRGGHRSGWHNVGSGARRIMGRSFGRSRRRCDTGVDYDCAPRTRYCAAAVERALQAGDINRARREIRALVGRDPDSLDQSGLICAAVESVAENCSDGVIAPMLYLFAGGPVAAMAYKAINTLDSMIGYLDDRYRWFGRSAARLDDLANLLPARITALCLIGAAGTLSRRHIQAYTACLASASTHPSPNAGYAESAMAGALGIRLGGDAIYGGEVEHRPPMGIAERRPLIADIADARAMMRLSTIFAFLCLSTRTSCPASPVDLTGCEFFGQRACLSVILSKVSSANEVERSRTAAELARRPEDQRDEGSSSRKRSRCRSLESAKRSAVDCDIASKRSQLVGMTVVE
jgi:CobD/Cbib protein